MFDFWTTQLLWPAGLRERESPMSTDALDVVILGSGVAGLSTAVRLGRAGMRVGVLTKSTLSATTTAWAQGGVAAVIDELNDSFESHVADTLKAGVGLCDRQAVEALVADGPEAVTSLIEMGALFDRDSQGAFDLALEGGHSAARVLHTGGVATGIEVQDALVRAASDVATLLAEGVLATELLIGENGIEGVALLGIDGPGEIRCPRVVLATGGAGQLYEITTNPPQATGDGLAMALRAGIPVADVEFVQFHPTALFVHRRPRPLLSEALRGHGALLRDAAGNRFVDELEPRDVVARAIVEAAQAGGLEHAWLDCTGMKDFSERFSSLMGPLADAGLDPAVDWLPVAPAAHHLAGGVLTDLSGHSAVDGLLAVGEVADAGVHGANRLASNSLLEGLVFGARAAESLLGGGRAAQDTGALGPWRGGGEGLALEPITTSTQQPMREDDSMDFDAARTSLALAMTQGAGVRRDASSLERTLEVIRSIGRPAPTSLEAAELANLACVAEAVVTSALARTESRGGHFRTDFPETSAAFEYRLVHGERR